MKPQAIEVGSDGLVVHYFRAGKGDPLLYLHHFLGLVDFEPALARLAETFDVIAPYAPGWGPAKDDLPRMQIGALDLALHQQDVLDALGVDAAHVAGIGIGAWMAAELAAIAPARVRRLVLVNPVGMWIEQANGEDPFAQNPGAPSEVLFSEPALRKQLLLEGRDALNALVDELLALRASAKFLWPIMETGVGRRLSRIKAPTLVVTSSADKVVPAAHGEVWATRIRNARHGTLPGAGHLAELEQPDAFAALVREFAQSGQVAAVA